MTLAPLLLAATLAPIAVTSTDVAQGAPVAQAFLWNADGCTGRNVSPQIAWRNPPPGTKSFAVTIYDPDAPTGHGWRHWAVANIPPTVRALPRGASAGPGLPPHAVQARNDYGSAGYGGPCPPPGPAHHYVIRVSALRTPALSLAPDATAAAVEAAIAPQRIGSAILTPIYGR